MNISEAEQLRESIHYNNEISVAFKLFLTKFHKMCNIFKEEGDTMEKDDNICFLFKLVYHSYIWK